MGRPYCFVGQPCAFSPPAPTPYVLGPMAAGAEHLAVEQRAIGPTPTVVELEAAIAIPAALTPLPSPPQRGFSDGSSKLGAAYGAQYGHAP